MIVEVCEGIQAKLTESLGSLGEVLPTFGLGKSGLDASETFPRIVFIPRGGQIDGRVTAGSDGVLAQRHLMTRHLQIDAHVWAENITAVEILAEQLVVAAKFMLGTSLKGVSEAWDTEGQISDGQVGVFSFTFEMPFASVPLRAVKPTTVAITGNIVAQVVA